MALGLPSCCRHVVETTDQFQRWRLLSCPIPPDDDDDNDFFMKPSSSETLDQGSFMTGKNVNTTSGWRASFQ